MRKRDEKKSEKKLKERCKAGESYWERINTDPDFIQAKRKLQARYNLPLSYDIRINNSAWLDWLGLNLNSTSLYSERGAAFNSDVKRLLDQFNIPPQWQGDIIAAIAGTSIFHRLEFNNGAKFEIGNNGEWRCIITTETDLSDPLLLQFIQNQQKAYSGKPPQPTRDKTNPRRLDWRNVYEWYKSHPLFTIEEVARKINYPAQRVRLKFAELENDN